MSLVGCVIVAACLSESFHSLVSLHLLASMSRGLSDVIVVVLSSLTVGFSLENVVVYPASDISGTLINVECRPGMMFISHAVGQRLCCNIIFFVALLFLFSGT